MAPSTKKAPLVLACLTITILFVYLIIDGPGLPVTNSELRNAYGGKRVVVCGASRGIGAKIAHVLADAGAHITLAARSKDKLKEVSDECLALGAASVYVHPVDFSTKRNCQGLVNAAAKAMGGIDVLVLNHVQLWDTFGDWSNRIMNGHASPGNRNLIQTLDTADEMFKVNALSYIYLSSFALPELAKSGNGRIIVVGSMAGKVPMPRVAPYASTKYAIFGYFDSLRHDLMVSPNKSLRTVGITSGVLGSFDTQNNTFANESMKAMYTKNRFVKFDDPRIAARDLLKGSARGWKTVYTPWSSARVALLFHSWMPTTMERLFSFVVRSSEVKEKSPE